MSNLWSIEALAAAVTLGACVWLACGVLMFAWQLWRMVRAQRQAVPAGQAMALGWVTCNLGLLACLLLWPVLVVGEIVSALAGPKPVADAPAPSTPAPDAEFDDDDEDDNGHGREPRDAGTWR